MKFLSDKFLLYSSPLASLGVFYIYEKKIKPKLSPLRVYADSLSYSSAIVDNNITYYPGKFKPDPKANEIPDFNNLTLINVQVFYRHGARTPLKRLPGLLGETEWKSDLFTDAHKFTKLPCKWVNFMGNPVDESIEEDLKNKDIVFNGGTSAGLLTALGHKQIFALGQRLRQEYIVNRPFVDSTFNHHQVYARCTNIDRMKHSSHVLISSMFEAPVKLHNDDSKEIIIAVEDLGREFMFPNPRICSPLIEVINAYIKAMDTLPSYTKDLEIFKKLLRIPKDCNVTVTEIYDTMKAMDAHDLPKPLPIAVDWDEWMAKFEKYVHQSYNMLLHLDKHTFRHSLRWSIGPVLDTILANMRSAMTCSGFYKMALYAIHDSTLNPMLMVLGNFRAWVPFASDLVFELYEDDKKQAWIRVLYMGQPIKLPGSESELCSITHFMSIVARMAAPFETFCSEKHGRIPQIKFLPSYSIGI